MKNLNGLITVFTNGCFDLLHPGHIESIQQIKRQIPNSYLIIGINSDASVKRLKGENRPLYNETERMSMLLALKGVDYVEIFDEDTPDTLIKKLSPDILVKGPDYYTKEVVGFNNIIGGLIIMKRIGKYSTSNILRRIADMNKSQ